MRIRVFSVWLPAVLAVGALSGCGGDPDLDEKRSTVDDAGEGGEAGDGSAGSQSGGRTNGGSSNTGGVAIAGMGNRPAAGSAGAEPIDPCELIDCSAGQRCEVDGDEASCVDNECGDLNCSDTEECMAHKDGGHVCDSIACESDVECPISRYCNGTICVDDACEPDTRTCSGDEVLVCSSNGGQSEPTYSCGSAGHFESTCDDSDPARTGCDCEDDWDCPPFTVCEAGLCTGTGREPTCTLPPPSFEDVLPQLEFRWGGENASNSDATDRPFPWSAQVTSTPIVANLDDDNGDGLIDERDFPEILFISYHGSQPQDQGVVRAVHGGGPNKGQDYFALCGETHWFEGDALADDCDPSDSGDSRAEALGRSGGALAVGDLNGDGLPEIVVPIETGAVQILNNRGEIITTSPRGIWPTGDWRYPTPAIANLDHQGLAEIIVGNRVLVLDDASGSIEVSSVFTGQYSEGTMHHGRDEGHHGPSSCAADLTDEFDGLEIVAGTSAYRLPAEADCAAEPSSDYCRNRLTLLWDGRQVNPNADFYHEGFCAVADVLGEDTAAAPGPDNQLDQVPEVLIVSDGHLLIFNAKTGELLRDIDTGGGEQGGAANVDDFDGDGFPEIATALSDFYVVIDLQEAEADNCPEWPDVLPQLGDPPGDNPARMPGGTNADGACASDADCNAGAVCSSATERCVCLHNGWRRDTEDDSSRVTSSSVFDFNGDGAAEVVYNDECYFRLYDGATGGIYLAIPSLSRTIIENPVVADVDNDGNAEIVFVQNNEYIQCDERPLDSWPDGDDDVAVGSLPNGLEVWGDPSDTWVAARRIWNQHSYHVTNVTESGAIPLHEPESWRPLNGRLYNTYRSQPRNYDVAPDLVLTAIQIFSPDVACGQLSDEIEITVEVHNQGDLRVGPGVVIEFFGDWQQDPAMSAALEDGNGDPITVTLDVSLEPGASTLVSVSYEAGNNGRDDLPSEITAVVDGANAERECNEDNNEVSGPVDPGEALADIRLEIDSASGCTPPEVKLTLYNDGAEEAEDILVRIYAGDPSSGGSVIGEVTVAGPIAPGESESVTVELEDLTRNVTLWGRADPLDTIEECNDANNVAEGPRLECSEIVQ